jgi:hypothetical protein
LAKKAATYLVRVTVYEREPGPTRVPGQFTDPDPVDAPTLATIEALVSTAISASLNTEVNSSAERVDQ